MVEKREFGQIDRARKLVNKKVLRQSYLQVGCVIRIRLRVSIILRFALPGYKPEGFREIDRVSRQRGRELVDLSRL
jgi:hypothetical protein